MMAPDHFGFLSADMLMWVRQPAGGSYSCSLNEKEVVHSYPIASAAKPIEATIWITLHKQFMVAAGRLHHDGRLHLQRGIRTWTRQRVRCGACPSLTSTCFSLHAS